MKLSTVFHPRSVSSMFRITMVSQMLSSMVLVELATEHHNLLFRTLKLWWTTCLVAIQQRLCLGFASMIATNLIQMETKQQQCKHEPLVSCCFFHRLSLVSDCPLSAGELKTSGVISNPALVWMLRFTFFLFLFFFIFR